jgi:hypothetical protein
VTLRRAGAICAAGYALCLAVAPEAWPIILTFAALSAAIPWLVRRL